MMAECTCIAVVASANLTLQTNVPDAKYFDRPEGLSYVVSGNYMAQETGEDLQVDTLLSGRGYALA